MSVFSKAVDIHAKGFALVFEAEPMGDQHLAPADFFRNFQFDLFTGCFGSNSNDFPVGQANVLWRFM